MHTFDVPDIRVRELLAIVALAEYGSFVAAAAYLKTSQPALTRAVKRVEKQLGVMLFARNTRRVEITSAGREFVLVAERTLNDLQLTVRNISDATKEQHGRITISTFSAFAVHSLPELVRRYRDMLPAMEVRIREGRQSDIVEDVRSGGADFGIGYVDSVPDTLGSELLRKEPMYVAIPSAHTLAKKRQRVRLEELRDEVLISPPSDTFLRRLIDGAAAGSGISFHYGVTVERLLSLIGHVRAGVGIAIIPEGVLPPKPWKDFEALVLAEPALTVSVGLITLPSRYITPAAASMMALIREGAKSEASAATMNPKTAL